MPIPKLKNGAILIADSHYSACRKDLLRFLSDVLSGAIATPQLVLMGDIFDLLIGSLASSLEQNKEAVELIRALARKIEVVYFEGNHDFLLNKAFESVSVIGFSAQPKVFEANTKIVLLGHGDYGSGLKYFLYTKLIRNKIFVAILNILTLNFIDFRFLKKKTDYLNTKNICTKIKNFDLIIQKRVDKYLKNADFFVEGHYHQGAQKDFGDKKYINLASFACVKSYYCVEYTENSIKFVEKAY
ncbi:MAG: UDP-2,3-diacylglucosamine diphosphatase [Helicobacteraceae bacterium]